MKPTRRDPERFLRVDGLSSDLRRQSIAGATAALAAQVAKLVLRFGSMILLSRLLMPSEFGLIAMVAAVIAFAELFREFGLSSATIQREDITHQQVSNLFWVNAAIGLAAAILVAISAPAVVWFYDEPRLRLITVLLALNIFLGALGVQHQAILRRQMQFNSLARSDVLSMAVGIVVGVSMGVRGGSYWSLVGMALATSLTFLVAVWTSCQWRPAMPRKKAGTRSLLRFGRDLYLASLSTYLSRNLDNILIGWRWGSEPLGLYNRAYQVFMLPVTQVVGPFGAVLSPALSRLQSDPERYRRYFRKTLAAISAITMPIAAICVMKPHEVVTLLFGPAWSGAGPILRVLSIAGVLQPMTTVVGAIYISYGRTRELLVLSLVSSAVIVTSFFIGLPYGALGVATAYAIARGLLLPLALYAVSRVSPVSVLDFGRAASIPVLGAAVAGSAIYLLVPVLQLFLERHVAFFLSCALAYAGAIGAQYALDRNGVLREAWQEAISRLRR